MSFYRCLVFSNIEVGIVDVFVTVGHVFFPLDVLDVLLAAIIMEPVIPYVAFGPKVFIVILNAPASVRRLFIGRFHIANVPSIGYVRFFWLETH